MATTLYVSIVDIVMGAGLAGVVNNSGSRTCGVSFAASAAGIACTGARGYWAGGATSLKVSLWDHTHARVATKTITVSGAGLWTATFASSVALSVGTGPYVITFWDTSGVNYTSYNGTTSGTAPLGDILPGASSSAAPTLFAPGLSLAIYSAISSDGKYGPFGSGDAVPLKHISWRLVSNRAHYHMSFLPLPDITLTGSTPGSVSGESVELINAGPSGAPGPANAYYTPKDTYSDTIEIRACANGYISSTPVMQSFVQRFAVTRASGVTSISASDTVDQFGDAAASSWTFAVTVGVSPDRLSLTFTTGSTTAVVNVTSDIFVTRAVTASPF